jgi:ABC-type sugar transport system ATPase subunit
MALIELRDVSLKFAAPLEERFRFQFKSRARLPEDHARQTRTGIIALDHINLTIPDGQTFVVVGPSGCGKSTLLRAASGLDLDYTGHILYDGVEMEKVSPGDRYIGMVFQNYALYPNFKGEGNLSFFFRMHKIDDEATRERIRYTSELMGIGFDELLPRRPGTLSGGQKQRLAIARAIVRAPRLFLFDEPLSNLDAQLRVQTRVEIKRLLHRFGLTAIYVTHDQVEAIALADQIVVMRSGKIEQVGPYQELIDHPVNLFVAGFLGLSPMTLLPGGRVLGDKLILDGLGIPLPERVRAVIREGQTLVIGLRAEAVSLAGTHDLSPGIQLKGEIEIIEHDFAHHTQILQLRTGKLVYPGLCSINMQLKIGDTIPVRIDPERLYFFDQQSGLAL